MWSIVLALVFLQAVAPPPPLPPETVTELEQALLDNAVLQEQLAKAWADHDACRATLAPHRTAENQAIVAQRKAAVKARIEAAHPGYHLTDQGTLEKRPSSAPAATPPTP